MLAARARVGWLSRTGDNNKTPALATGNGAGGEPILCGSFRLAPLVSAIDMSILLQNCTQLLQGARIERRPPVIQGGFVIARAAEKAGSSDLDALTKALRSAQFSTVLGDIGFDEKGDVTAPGYVFYQWKDGNYDNAQTM